MSRLAEHLSGSDLDFSVMHIQNSGLWLHCFALLCVRQYIPKLRISRSMLILLSRSLDVIFEPPTVCCLTLVLHSLDWTDLASLANRTLKIL